MSKDSTEINWTGHEIASWVDSSWVELSRARLNVHKQQTCELWLRIAEHPSQVRQYLLGINDKKPVYSQQQTECTRKGRRSENNQAELSVQNVGPVGNKPKLSHRLRERERALWKVTERWSLAAKKFQKQRFEMLDSHSLCRHLAEAK
jgi:hypothetical protein